MDLSRAGTAQQQIRRYPKLPACWLSLTYVNVGVDIYQYGKESVDVKRAWTRIQLVQLSCEQTVFVILGYGVQPLGCAAELRLKPVLQTSTSRFPGVFVSWW